MTNLTTIPLQDGFETTLAQAWNGSSTTVYVNSTPTATFAGSISTYLVVDPGLSTMQVVPCTAYDSVAKTFTVTTAPTPKGNGVNYSAVSHSAGAVVRISDNYAFWSDMLNAINTKLDDNGGNGKDYADTAARDAALGGDGAATKNYRLIKAGSNYYNYNLSTNQWQVVSTGTAPTNASTTVAGVVEIADSIEITNGTDTGATGAKTVVQPSHLKAVSDSISALKIKDKDDVACATTADITLSGAQTIDGYSAIAGNRVLVKNQSTASQNGIYIVAAGAWTRATDFDANTNNEVDLGANIWVQNGTVNAGSNWTLTTTGAITVGSTGISFTRTYPNTDVSCRVIPTAGTSISFTSWGSIAFASEDYDTNGFHDNVTNNSRLTIPTGLAGKYIVTGCVGQNNNFKNIRILKNGTTTVAQTGIGDGGTTGGATVAATWNISRVLNLAVGDYVELQAYNSAGTSQSTDTAITSFDIQKIA